MDIPKPDVLNAYLDDIEHACKTIHGLYRTAESNAHSRPVHGSEELVSGGGDKADLADIVAATEKYRRLVRHCAREVVDARNRVQGAVADLNDALALLDPPPGPPIADVRFIEDHRADAGDRRRAEQAQKRRMARARASGDYSEVGW